MLKCVDYRWEFSTVVEVATTKEALKRVFEESIENCINWDWRFEQNLRTFKGRA